MSALRRHWCREVRPEERPEAEVPVSDVHAEEPTVRCFVRRRRWCTVGWLGFGLAGWATWHVGGPWGLPSGVAHAFLLMAAYYTGRLDQIGGRK